MRRRLDTQETFELFSKISQSFSPSAPIDSKALFAGRIEQIADVLNAFHQRGQHVVIFGERGVGKTSLANVLVDMAVDPTNKPACGLINCDQSTTFSKLWHSIFREMPISKEIRSPGFASEPTTERQSLADYLPTKNVRPDDIRNLLQKLDKTLIVIDEVDRIKDKGTATLLADTVKNLSDHSVDTTIVLVGVADSVDTLIAEHASVQRALVQVRMPRMSKVELFEIIDKGLKAIRMNIRENAKETIAVLSQGLPHYTHLLGLHSAQCAVTQRRKTITLKDTTQAIKKALRQAQQTIANDYHRAITSPRENLYKQVLLACALAQADPLGYFSAGDVRQPMSLIMGKQYEIPAFSQHLNAFCEDSRGRILQRTGTARRFRFRFTNPLMQPYVIMSGLNSGLIDEVKMAYLTSSST